MGNYATCKKYTQKEKNQFTLLTRNNFSLIAKNCVGLGIGTLCAFFSYQVISVNKGWSDIFDYCLQPVQTSRTDKCRQN